jgi:hypothetical protein
LVLNVQIEVGSNQWGGASNQQGGVLIQEVSDCSWQVNR